VVKEEGARSTVVAVRKPEELGFVISIPIHSLTKLVTFADIFVTVPFSDLLSVIMKSGDDLRQEQLAAQLIRVFDDIFRRNNLPLWLKPYEVVPTSAIGGYVEVVHDAISIHSLKEQLSADDSSLRSYFIKAYGDKTPEFLVAQRNFTESLAAYSLVCYLLQIKDRHNAMVTSYTSITVRISLSMKSIDYGILMIWCLFRIHVIVKSGFVEFRVGAVQVDD
jgi:hypothetical protein